VARNRPGRRQVTVLHLEPKRAVATVGYFVMTLVFLALAGAALLYRTDRWPDRWRPEVQIPDRAVLIAAGVTGLFAILCFVAAIANARRWHTAAAVERLSDDPDLASLAPKVDAEPPGPRAQSIPPLEVRMMKGQKLPKPREGLHRVTADRNIIGRRPLRIAYLRLFENQPRMRTFVEGAWREFGTVYLLRGAGSVTPAEFRLAKRSGNPGRMFITSREQFRAVLDAPERGPNPKGRYIFRSIGATTIRVRDRYGSYAVRGLLCHGAFWKAAIDMLLARMDLVVLDLSGFRPQNVGTGYEVQRVIDRFPIEGVVFLADQRSNGKFLTAQLQQSWAQMASGSPNATREPRVAMIVVTDYYARSQSQAGGQGGQASNVQVRLVARRSQTRRVAAMAQGRIPD
jgi:hypothetical protein